MAEKSRDMIEIDSLGIFPVRHALPQGGENESRKGMEKLRQFCHVAKRCGFNWAWSDTCCIDKANHSELSESIISMFLVVQEFGTHHSYTWGTPTSMRWRRVYGSRRGWTLQELLAPRVIQLYKKDWTPFGKAGRPARERLEVGLRQGRCFKKEDEAYSMVGIHELHTLTIQYGIREKAFRSMQEELLKRQQTSGLAWTGSESLKKGAAYLAQSPNASTSHLDTPHLENVDPIVEAMMKRPLIRQWVSTIIAPIFTTPHSLPHFRTRVLDVSCFVYPSTRARQVIEEQWVMRIWDSCPWLGAHYAQQHCRSRRKPPGGRNHRG
ncbi:hypothetical protein BU15DRAFT_61339 [Melanogaster broomeanus]|nr:hypothetical protein BU15DRAFT_61339 [Melanogaster broomeanus]